MAAGDRARRPVWALADRDNRFGPIPFDRIRSDPKPGSGTAVKQSRRLQESDTLVGGDVPPGFALPSRDLCAEPLEGGPAA